MGDQLIFAANLSVDDDSMRQSMAQLCELLSADVGQPVEPHHAPTPSLLAHALASGRAQFAWLSPTLLLSAKSLATMVPLLSSLREEVAFFHSVVFAASGSGIESLADIAAKRVAWVAPSSASGYLVPRLTLARRGVEMDAAFELEEFLGSHGAVAKSVFSGESEIGATYAHFKHGDAEQPLLATGYSVTCPREEAVVLAVSGPIPADMIVAHPSVPIAQRVAFAAAMSRLPTDPVGKGALAQVIGADEFRAVTHQALTELQALMKATDEYGM
jgi:phosphonate transport system substrate-binding protein